MFKRNDAIQITYNAIVQEVGPDFLKVKDVEKELEFYIRGNSLLNTTLSADFSSSSKKLNKTEIVEVLLNSHGKSLRWSLKSKTGAPACYVVTWLNLNHCLVEAIASI